MDYIYNVMTGANRGPGATALRLAAALAEPFYSTAMRARNRLFDIGAMRSFDLGRPTISVGNITTGGTGKTPMVRWLAEHLRSQGRHVAVLARVQSWRRFAGRRAADARRRAQFGVAAES